ncbi:MAG: sle [Frankiales bacterium]|jgi:hypothetical protein|nr:sle [Frankiales bacterium]
MTTPLIPDPPGGAPRPRATRLRRLGTETKAGYKTTEFLAYVLAVIAVAVAAQTIGNDSGAGPGGDYFRADKALFYITLLTIGYMVSRGLAKAGTPAVADDEHEHEH